MKVWAKRIAAAIGGIVLLAVIAAAAIHVASERELQRQYDVRPGSLLVPTDAASIAEGQRLASVHGCLPGCHGQRAEGRVMFDDPMVGRIVAPDLSAAVRRYDDGEFAAIVRQGVRPDGRSLLVMPSEAYASMSDVDLGRIVGFLRSLPAAHGPGPQVDLGPLGRFGLATGKFRTAARIVAETNPPPAAHGVEAERGRYLARLACGHCHSPDLHGDSNPSFTSPDLHVVAAYSPEAFARLVRTGRALGDRELGMMSRWARSNLSHLTDDEIAALYTYLSSMDR